MELNHPSANGCPSYRQAQLNRRSFLKAGTLSALGFSLSQYLGLQEARGATAPRAKSPRGLDLPLSSGPKPGKNDQQKGGRFLAQALFRQALRKREIISWPGLDFCQIAEIPASKAHGI